MKISDLIKHLENIKKEKGDLMVCGGRNGAGIGSFILDDIVARGVTRPEGRKKLYELVWGKEKGDFEVVYIPNARGDNLEK